MEEQNGWMGDGGSLLSVFLAKISIQAL